MSVFEPQADGETYRMTPDFLSEHVQKLARADAARTERALLAGGDRIEVETITGGRVLYTLPRWRRHPIARARITIARRRAARLRETR